MKLDPRIKEFKKPLTPFDNEEAKKYIGKECYFSCVATDFGELEYCAKGIMRLVAGECPFAFEDDEGNYHGCTYCLPCEWVEKEKNYRPFTAYEFQKLFNIGDVICIRRKNTKVVENLLYAGFKSDAGDLPYILLGNEWHDFGELFAEFEYIDDGDFKPFGVEE